MRSRVRMRHSQRDTDVDTLWHRDSDSNLDLSARELLSVQRPEQLWIAQW